MSASGSGSRPGGLLDSLRRIGATLVGIAHTRLELAVTELEEQRLRLWQLALLAFAALCFAALALVFGTLAVAMVYWDRNPVAVLGGFAFFYLALAIVVALVLRARARARPRLLSATLDELARDREQLTPP